MNMKNILYLFGAVVLSLIVSGFIQSQIAMPADPVLGGVGVPLLTGGLLTVSFIAIRKFIFNKNDV